MALRERILIIGNGFDLYHELPTKYSQFIKVLINIEKLNLDDDKDIIFEDLFQYVERYSEMKVKFDTEQMFFKKDKIIDIKNKLQNSSWYKSFKGKLDFEHWIDVENEIKTALKIIDKIVLEINSTIKKNKNIHSIYINLERSINSLNLNSEELLYLYNFGFQNTKDKKVIDLNLIKIVNNFNIEFKKEQFYENLFVELQLFTDVFNLYLNEIVSLFYKKIDSKYASNLESIKEKIDLFYTFNYTPTLEEFYLIKEEKINYLHGKHRSENHNIVLGIDDVELEFKKDKFFMFTKYYQKLFNNTNYEFLFNKKSKSEYDSSDKDFILFGHSLADNDQNYIQELFDVTKQRKNNTITILYYSLSDKAQKLKNLLKIIGREDVELLMKLRRLVFVEINDKPFETIFNLLPISDIDSYGDPYFNDIKQ